MASMEDEPIVALNLKDSRDIGLQPGAEAFESADESIPAPSELFANDVVVTDVAGAIEPIPEQGTESEVEAIKRLTGAQLIVKLAFVGLALGTMSLNKPQARWKGKEKTQHEYNLDLAKNGTSWWIRRSGRIQANKLEDIATRRGEKVERKQQERQAKRGRSVRQSAQPVRPSAPARTPRPRRAKPSGQSLSFVGWLFSRK